MLITLYKHNKQLFLKMCNEKKKNNFKRFINGRDIRRCLHNQLQLALLHYVYIYLTNIYLFTFLIALQSNDTWWC